MVGLGIFRKLGKPVKFYLFVSCVLVIAVLGTLDLSSSEALDFSVFYIIPISIAAWYLRAVYAYSLVLVASLAWLYAEWKLGTRFSPFFMVINWSFVLLNYTFVAFLIRSVRSRIKNEIRNEAIRHSQKAAIETTQKVCGLIGEKVTKHNAEIINWVHKRKANGAMPPEVVERSSLLIGKNLGVLTEVAFMDVSEERLAREGYESYLKSIEAKLEEA
jgi:hypothetical protein